MNMALGWTRWRAGPEGPRTRPPWARYSDTRQVAAWAWRLTLERASRASWTTSPAWLASSAATWGSTSATATTPVRCLELLAQPLQGLVEVAVGQDHRLPGPQDLAGHRPLDREDRPPATARRQPVGRLDPQLPRPGRQGQGGQVGPGQLPGVADHQ